MTLVEKVTFQLFEAAEAVIRGTHLRRSRFGREVVAGLNRFGQRGLAAFLRLRGRPITVQGQKMHLRALQNAAFKFSMNMLLDRYEPGTVGAFQRLLQPGMVVIDIGAHAGYFSLVAASRVGTTGKVYAFEPHPESFEQLQENIELNGYTNVLAVRQAVAGKTGTMKFFLNPKGSDRHGLYAPGIPGVQLTEVETTTLDHFLELHGWPRVDLIKMDIEGAEPAVLEGMGRALEECGIQFIIAEFSPVLLQAAGFDPQVFLEQLVGFGFTLHTIEDGREPRLLEPRAFTSLIQDLKDKGGANILCQRARHNCDERSGNYPTSLT